MLTWKSPNCSRNYQRITELEQEEEQKDDVCSSCHAPAARAKRTAEVGAAQNEDPDSDEEDVKGLVRVRLITANPRHPALDPDQSRPLQREASAAFPSLPSSSRALQNDEISAATMNNDGPLLGPRGGKFDRNSPLDTGRLRLLNTRYELAPKINSIPATYLRNWYCCRCGANMQGYVGNAYARWSNRCEAVTCGHEICPYCVRTHRPVAGIDVTHRAHQRNLHLEELLLSHAALQGISVDPRGSVMP